MRPLQKLLIIICMFAFFGLAYSQQESNDFSYALKLYNEGFYDISAQQFENFIERYSGSERLPDARYYRGDALFKLDDIENARIEFQTLAVSFPEHSRAPQGWFKVGECYEKQGKFSEAAKSFETVKILYPGNSLAPKALLQAGNALMKVKEFPHAEQVIRDFLNRYVESAEYPRGRILYGKILFAKGEPERANGEFESVLKVSEDPAVQAEARLGQAEVFRELGLTHRAEQSLNAIIAANPGSEMGYQAALQLSRLYIDGRKWDQAVALVRQTLAKNSAADQQAALKLTLSQAFFLQGDYFQARTTAESINSKQPDVQVKRDFYLASAQLAEKRYDAAESSFKALIEQTAQNSTFQEYYLASLQNLTRLYLEKRNFQAARTYLDRYNTVSPDDPGSEALHRSLVELAFRNNMLSAGVDELQRFRGVHPHSAFRDDLLFSAGKAYFRNRQFDRSLIYFEQVADEYIASAKWDSSRIYIDFINTYYRQGQSQGVKKLAQLMGKMFSGTDRKQLLFELGKVYLSDLRDYGEAAHIFEQYVAEAKDSSAMGEGLYYLSESYMRLANFAEFSQPVDPEKTNDARIKAVATLKRAVATAKYSPHPDSLTYHFLTLSAPATATPPEKYIQYWEAFAQRYSDSPLMATVRLQLADAYQISGDNVAAMAQLAGVTIANSDPLQAGTARWKTAELQFAQGQTDAAIQTLKGFLLEFPQHPYQAKGYEKLAGLFAEQQDYSLAAQFLERMVNLFDYADEAIGASIKISDYYTRSNNDKKALDFVAQTIQRYNTVDDPVVQNFLAAAPPEMYFYAGKAYFQQNKFADARQNLLKYLRAVREDDAQGQALLLLGEMAQKDGDNESALLQLELIKKAEDPAVFYQANAIAADILFNEENYTEALKKYNMLIAENTESDQKIAFEGQKLRCLVQLGQVSAFKSQVNAFKKNYANQPGVDNYLAAAIYEQAKVAFSKKSFDSSINFCKKILSRYKKSSYADDAQYMIGRNYATLNQGKKALEEFHKFLKNYPKSDLAANVYLTIADIHFRNEETEQGVAAVRQAVAVASNPETEQAARSSIISTYKSLGLWDGALQNAREYVGKFPNAKDIIDQRITIGVALTRLNRFAEAVDYLKKLKFDVTSEDEPEIQFYIGEAYFNGGQYQQAVNEFMKIPLLSQKTKLQWEASALYYAGQSYEKLGRTTEAMRMYQEIIDRPGIQVELKRQARKLIDNLKSFN